MPSAAGWSGSEARAPAGLTVRVLDDPEALRRAGRDLLSLALIDTRNHLLHTLAQHESPAALRIAAQAGWYAEHWIVCHVQCQRGEACDPTAPRLGRSEPRLDGWRQGDGEPPAPAELRDWLTQTLEATLELLHVAHDSDAGLHFFRLALAHEDRCGEALLAALAQHQRTPHSAGPVSRVQGPALWLPAQRWCLGSEPAGGLVPAGERWAHEVMVPEFEIDAQAVSWARWVEFAADGGYDQRAFWSEPGWGLDAGQRSAGAAGRGATGGRRAGAARRRPAARAGGAGGRRPEPL